MFNLKDQPSVVQEKNLELGMADPLAEEIIYCAVCQISSDDSILTLIDEVVPRHLPFSIHVIPEYRCPEHLDWVNCSYCRAYFDSAFIRYTTLNNFAYPVKLCPAHQNYICCLQCTGWKIPVRYKNEANKKICSCLNKIYHRAQPSYLLRYVLTKQLEDKSETQLSLLRQEPVQTPPVDLLTELSEDESYHFQELIASMV